MTEAKINLNNLDKSNWQSYRFDEIAQSISERIDPTNTDLEVYVGLEHIDSESIHLKRHGHKSDVKGQKLRFYQGDVIFGRRRAYQRKAAVAEMDGFCSAHALVLRAKPDVILPELFPFFLHSDQFMNRAVDISVGSLSPTINWGSLKKETFVIPPKEQQLKLAELFWAADEVIEKSINSKSSLEQAYSSFVDNYFSKLQEGWQFIQLSKVADINNKSLNSKTSSEYEFCYLDISSIIKPKQLGEMKRLKYINAPSRARRIVSDKASVIALVRPYQQSFVFVNDAKDIIASTGTAVIESHSDTNPRLLFHQFFSSRFLQFSIRMMTGSTYPAITPDDLALYKIAIPGKDQEQNNVVGELDALEEAITQLNKNLENSIVMQQTLINQVF